MLAEEDRNAEEKSPLDAVLKRAATKKSRNDLIHAEEGEDRFADLCAVGESQGIPPALPGLSWTWGACSTSPAAQPLLETPSCPNVCRLLSDSLLLLAL